MGRIVAALSLLSLLATSCAVFRSGGEEQSSSNSYTVDFEGDRKESRIIISENEYNSDYGPSPLGQGGETLLDRQERSQHRQPIIALDLYPALYHSLGYVATFAELEKAGVTVNIISANGFSSVIGALYSKYASANMVEWKAFELYQRLEGRAPYSEDWMEVVEDFAQKEFGDSKLSQQKKILLIPVVDGNKTIFSLDRKVVDAIMGAVNLRGGESLLTGGDFSYLPALRAYGADEFIRISFLPGKIQLKRPNGFVFGLYSRLAGRIGQEVDSGRLFVFGEALSGELDAFGNLSDTIYRAKEPSSRLAQELKERLEKNSGKF